MQILDIVDRPSALLAPERTLEPVVTEGSSQFNAMLNNTSSDTQVSSQRGEYSPQGFQENKEKGTEKELKTKTKNQMDGPPKKSSKSKSSSEKKEVIPQPELEELVTGQREIVLPPEKEIDTRLLQMKEEMKGEESLVSEVKPPKETALKVMSHTLQAASNGDKKWEEAGEDNLKKVAIPQPSSEGKKVVKSLSPSFDTRQDAQEGRKDPEIHVFFSSRQSASSSSQTPALEELSTFFRETVLGHVVRYASIQLREQGSGELRLKLHPQSLGEIRISLHLHNDEVSGKIWVDNSLVKEAFEQNLQQLQQSLAQRGLQMNGISVFVSGEQSESFEEFTSFQSEHPTAESETDNVVYYDIAFDNSYVNVLV